MKKVCECCGQPLPDKNGILFKESLKTISWDTGECRLTGLEFEYLQCIYNAIGQAQISEATYDIIYSTRRSFPEIKILDVLRCKVNKKLFYADCPIRIESVWGKGAKISKDLSLGSPDNRHAIAARKAKATIKKKAINKPKAVVKETFVEEKYIERDKNLIGYAGAEK